jgi:hypothetical protein
MKDRDDIARSGPDTIQFHAEHLSAEVGGHDVGRRTIGHESSVMEHDHPRRKADDGGQIVRGDRDSAALVREASAEPKEREAVLEIEVRRGLVEEHHGGFGRQTARDRHALTFAARESIDRSRAQVLEVAGREGCFDRGAIAIPFRLKTAAVRVTAHGDHLLDRECEITPGVLRQKRHAARNRTARESGERRAVEIDRPH